MEQERKQLKKSPDSWFSAMSLVGAENATKPKQAKQVSKQPNPKDLTDFAEDWFELEKGYFSKRRAFDRKPERVRAKMIVRKYLMHNYGLSLVRTGHFSCRSHHATVMNSLARHDEAMSYDKEYEKMYRDFTKQAMERGFHARNL